jgi:hypothetical protein
VTSSTLRHRPSANSAFGKSFLAGEKRSARAGDDEEPLQHDECDVCALLVAAVARRVHARLRTVSEGAAGCCMFRKMWLQCPDIAQRHLQKKNDLRQKNQHFFAHFFLLLETTP